MSILRRIERYLKASGTPPTRFGRDAVRDPRLVHDLRGGRQLGGAVTARVSDYLDRSEQAGKVQS
jgi:hypothetical protein